MIPALELWGGIECSLVHLADRVDDQLARGGHDRRPEDLERLADLGLRTLRYPILWERHAAEPDWSWADQRLGRLRELGIRPIVGFLHHGCGPLPGGFLNPGFVAGLGAFAGAFARRYPWIDAYTPINEPLTTARFSGMYGLWQPCSRDLGVFARILVDQCHAIRAAMRAVREVNPAAQLVQTEDVGKTHSTELLAYQADLENERRWLSFDLLCGRVVPHTPFWRHLSEAGINESELAALAAEPCPPDILGMNHYVTSERFIDERLEHYPAIHHGGNGRHAYADVPAVRVRQEGVVGPAALLREVWARYRRPIAITEAQLACTREEQVRWLCEIWAGAQQVRSEGIPVRAVTAWALFGAYDWDTLLLQERGSYESGAFDVREGGPHETAVGAAIRSLVAHGKFAHPVAAGPGWWRRRARLIFRPVSAARTGSGTALPRPLPPDATIPLLIVASRPELFREICALRGLACRVVVPRESTEDLATDPPPWGVLMEAAAAPLLEARCRELGVPLLPLPEEYHPGTIRRTLDRLIDLACLEPSPVTAP